jgi:hypothetical protein
MSYDTAFIGRRWSVAGIDETTSFSNKMGSFIDISTVRGELDIIKLRSAIKQIPPRGGAATVEVLVFLPFVSKHSPYFQRIPEDLENRCGHDQHPQPFPFRLLPGI